MIGYKQADDAIEFNGVSNLEYVQSTSDSMAYFKIQQVKRREKRMEKKR